MGNTLVLGSNGFIGKHLSTALMDRGIKVIGYGRRDPNKVTLNSYVQGNFTEERDFVEIIRENNISCIYHLISTTTPQVGTANAVSEAESNILPTLRLLDAAVECDVDRIIFASSGGTVYGESLTGEAHKESEVLKPICGYGVQKATIEAYLKTYHRMHAMKLLVARIANPYGPCTEAGRTQGVIPIFIQQLLSGKGITVYGETVRDYIHINDVVDALLKLQNYAGEERTFNIGSGRGVHLHQIVEIIEASAGMRFSEVKHEPIRTCDIVNNFLDCSLAKRELGWVPGIGLEEG